jgi:ABC-type Fe3+-hydroxamate transport system substrate-binding protein
MPIFTDQMGREISLQKPPERIVSIVPSQTELLFDLGLGDKVAAITKFCVHPEEMFRTKPRAGGTKKLNFAKIRELDPDLIIGNKEENEREQVEALMKEYPVWMSDIYTLDDALAMIGSVGEITGAQQKAQEIISNIQAGFKNLDAARARNSGSSARTAYFIWRDPYMTVGSNAFIDHILARCGFTNAFSHMQRYPQITAADLSEAAPDLILLSSEPYPFKEKHIEEFRSICPNAKVMVVDGEMFSWYGSRLQHAPAYFEQLIRDIRQ